MTNIQEILNKIQTSEHNRREDQLVHLRKRTIVFEYNSKGEIINRVESQKKMRQLGIRLDKSRPSVITKDNRIFSIVKLENFEQWYKKRKKQVGHFIKQYNKDWEFLKEWETIAEAARSTNQSPRNIRRACKKGYLAGNYRWKSDFLPLEKNRV